MNGAGPAAGLFFMTLLPWLLCYRLAAPFPAAAELRGSRRAGARPGYVYMLAGGAAIVCIAWTLWRSNGLPVIMDESLYAFQADIFSRGDIALWIPREREDFFRAVMVAVRNGAVYSQYPPGWPGLIAAWSLAAPVHLLNPLLMAVLVVATAHLGRTLFDDAAGVLAATLVATSSMTLNWGATLFADLPATLLVALAAAAAAGAARSTRAAAALLAAAAGLAAGLAFTMRPLTIIALTPFLVLVTYCATADSRPSLRRMIRPLSIMAAVAAIPVAAMLWYNATLNGSPLVFGYQVAHGSLHDLGFGMRGFLRYDPTAGEVIDAFAFTPRAALLSSARHLALFDNQMLGGFVPPLLVALMLHGRLREIRPALLVAACLLPVFYGGWFFKDVRYYLPIVPIAAILIARGLSLPGAFGSKRGTLLLASVIASNLLFTPIATAYDGFHPDPLERASADIARHASIHAVASRSDSLVVFVADGDVLAKLFWINATSAGNDRTLVVRDLGQRNKQLLRSLQGWAVACMPSGGTEAQPDDASAACAEE